MSNAKTFQEWAKEILPIVEAAAIGACIQGRFPDLNNEWHDAELFTLLHKQGEYRIKPKTIRIGEYDVPAPETCALKNDAVYYVPTL